MKQTTELELAQPVREQPSVALMLQSVVEKGITADNVGALEKLVGLYERMQQKDAEKAFAEAFVRLQQEIPTIPGCRPGSATKDGKTKFHYANFEDIDAIVRPICLRNGFTYAFRESGVENGRITTTMTLQHSGGHYREIPCSVRVGAGPSGSSESQADMSAHAYARRGALEAGLALRIVGMREDAGVAIGVITPEQADELSRRVALVNANREAFLRFAGAAKFSEIPASNYDILDRFLTNKEKKQ